MLQCSIRTFTLLLLCLAAQTSGRGRRRAYRSKQNYMPYDEFNLTANNDVITKWITPDDSASVEAVDKPYRKPEPPEEETWETMPPEESVIYEDPGVTSEELSTMVAMLERLTMDVADLKNLLTDVKSSVKMSNHKIYNLVKKVNTRCLTQTQMPAMQKDERRVCPREFTWSEELGRCFLFRDERTSWRRAQERCGARGADLITIGNRQTQQYVTEMARKNKDFRHCDFWIGATDAKHETSWRWIANDQDVMYANWNHNEPNNGSGDEHCAMMLWVFNWAWNDAGCKAANACYICEAKLL